MSPRPARAEWSRWAHNSSRRRRRDIIQRAFRSFFFFLYSQTVLLSLLLVSFYFYFFVVPSGTPHLIGRARLKIILLRSIAVGVRSRRDTVQSSTVCVSVCVRTAATPDPNPFIQQDGASGIARLSIRRRILFFSSFSLVSLHFSSLSVKIKKKEKCCLLFPIANRTIWASV